MRTPRWTEMQRGTRTVAATTLSNVSTTLDRAGATARRAGLGLHDRLRGTARSLSRGESVVRAGGVGRVTKRALRGVASGKAAMLGAAGALTAGAVAVGLFRNHRR